jgi:hypothetical protein
MNIGGRKERRKMARTRAKRKGPVAYYLYRDAKSYQAGKPPIHAKFGPYASMKEAEAKREEEESGGLPGYEYHYRIAEPLVIPK